MNKKIEFKIVKKNDREWEGEYYVVRILINDKDLIDKLRHIEKPFAKREKKENNGGYEGIHPRDLYKNLTDEPIYEDNKTAILGCGCGCEGCWDFLVEVKEEKDKIIWTNFENSHRGPGKSNVWDYSSSFKELTFDKKEYFLEIKKLKEFVEKGN